MAHQSHMKTVLTTVIAIAEQNNGEASSDAVSKAMMAKTRQQHKNILNTLSELYRLGKLQRLRQGIYAPAITTKKPEKRQVMWSLLRMRKPGVTVDDLVELAEVSSDYAAEWLRMLAKREVVRRIDRPGKQALWIVVKDSIEMPDDDEKAARLRDLRAKKKAGIVSLVEKIETELQRVKESISDL